MSGDFMTWDEASAGDARTTIGERSCGCCASGGYEQPGTLTEPL